MAHNLFKMKFSVLYPNYIKKAERKGRTKEEVETLLCWLTGYSNEALQEILVKEITVEEFFSNAPSMNPNRTKITGKVCGVRVEEVEDPIMRRIRYFDKLIDELAKGKALEKIIRD